MKIRALLPQQDHGFARICAYHDSVHPGSVKQAEAYADILELTKTHGVCPECSKRILAEELTKIKNEKVYAY